MVTPLLAQQSLVICTAGLWGRVGLRSHFQNKNIQGHQKTMWENLPAQNVPTVKHDGGSIMLWEGNKCKEVHTYATRVL